MVYVYVEVMVYVDVVVMVCVGVVVMMHVDVVVYYLYWTTRQVTSARSRVSVGVE